MRRLWATWVLLAAFVGLFLLMERAGGSTNARVLLQFGAWEPSLALSQPWRLVSGAMLHIGIAHLVLNGLAIVTIGLAIERAYGVRAFWAAFVGTAAFGMGAGSIFYGLTAGASGGLYGLAGIYVGVYLKRRRVMDPAAKQEMERWIGSLVVNTILLAVIVPRINHAAHAGGFIAGAGLAFVMRPASSEGRGQKAWTALVGLAALAAMVLSAVHAGRIAEDPWDYPTREWREPETGATVRVPVVFRYERQKALHAFVTEGVSLGLHVTEARGDAGEAMAAEAGAFKDAKPGQRDGWVTLRGTLEGDEYETWYRVEKGRLFRLMLRAGADFEEMRPHFVKFAESLRVP